MCTQYIWYIYVSSAGCSVRSPSGRGCLGLDSEYLPHCTTSPRAPQEEESLLPVENKAISRLHMMHREINMCGGRCRRRKKKGVSLQLVFMHFELLTSVNKFINDNQITEMRVMFHQSAARVQKTRTLPDISRPAEAFIIHALCCALIPFPEVTRGALELKALPFDSGQLALHLCPPPLIYTVRQCAGAAYASAVVESSAADVQLMSTQKK